MQNNNTIKLLKLQAKNIKINKEVIDVENNTATFYISKKVIDTPCPCCGKLTKRIHDHRNQSIKHTPINGFKTFLVLKKTRLLCTNCNKKFYMDYSDIVNPKFRSSNQLFWKIIDDLKSSCSFKDVARMNFVSIGVVIRYLLFFSYLMQWQNVTTLPKNIGIDEFKGNCDNSKYLLHIFDLDTNKTIKILNTRNCCDIIDFFNKITNRNDVEIVTMDLYSPFKKAVQTKLKNAKIIADRFHYTRIVANAMDSLRIDIWRNTKGSEKKYLKHLKKKLLKDIESIPKDKLLDFEVNLNYAFEISSELKYGYQLYQSFLRIKDADTYQEKCKRFREWLDDASTCTIPTFKSAAETLIKWNKEILNSFKYSYSNGPTEGKNNKIKVIKRIAFGFKNCINFENRIKIRDSYI